jgi:hypothetical protein
MILSKEWIDEAEHSSEEIQICMPSSVIQCKIHGIMVDVLDNPTVGANIMSASFAATYFDNETLAPTVKTCRIAPRIILEGLGILHDISLYHGETEISLHFHVFDIKDFDVMIGHPLEKFLEPPSSGDLNVKLWRDTFSIPITRAKNLVAETLPYHDLPKEVMSVLPFESPELSLEKDAKLFIEEEDDLGETIDLPSEEVPAPPPVELKPLPTGLRYAFLNGDKNNLVIISDKLSDEETSKLITILE